MSPPDQLTPEMLTAHTAWVRRLARRLVDDPDLADDLVQSACVTAMQRPPRDVNLRAWFERVLRNLLRQGRRSERRRVSRERRAAVSGAAPSSAELAARLQMHRRVVDAVQSLGEPYRTVILLRYFQDLPPREIARMRAAPVATVNSQLSRGLDKLRERLDERHGGDRRAWSIALYGWLSNHPTGPVVAAGAYAVKLKAVVLVLVASLVGWAVFQLDWAGTPPRPAAPPADAAGTMTGRLPSGLDAGPDDVPVRSPVVAATAPPDPAPRFTGRVVDTGGAPLGGVALRWRNGPGAGGSVSDPAGRFSLPVPDRERQVVVEDPQLATVLAAHVGPDIERYRGDPVVVAAPALSLRGRIVDETGEPVESVTVACRLPEGFETRLPLALDLSHRPPWQAVTDEQGRFALPDLAQVEGANLYARRSGYLPLRLPQPTRSADDLVLTLERPVPALGSLQGQVLDPLGIPVSGALVSLGRAHTVSDASGLFVLRLQAAYGRRDLRALCPGFLPASVELPSDIDSSDFVYLQLAGAARTISGRVVDAAGAPVPGVRVWAEDASAFFLDDEIAAIEGYLGGNPSPDELRRGTGADAVDEDGEDRPNALWGWVEADDRGHFELGGLLDRAYRLGAMQLDSLARVVAGPFPAGSRGVEIVFPVDAVLPRVAGRVVGRDGTPVADVRVTPLLWPLMVSYVDDRADLLTGVRRTRAPARTDAEGRFEFEHLGRFVQFDVEGDGILPHRHGDHQQDLLEGGSPVDALRIEVSRRVRLRVELGDPTRADSFRAYDRYGQRRLLHKFSGSLQGQLDSLPIVDGRSEVCGVDELTTAIAFLRDGQEVGRTDVRLTLGEINVITW